MSDPKGASSMLKSSPWVKSGGKSRPDLALDFTNHTNNIMLYQGSNTKMEVSKRVGVTAVRKSVIVEVLDLASAKRAWCERGEKVATDYMISEGLFHRDILLINKRGGISF